MSQGKIGGPSLVEDIVDNIMGIIVVMLVVGGILTAVFITLTSILALTLPECPTEDSSNCYWDGGPNGQGDKFLDLFDGTIVIVLDYDN